MATVSEADSRRMYSWWWNSHVSPKNSKWLQENLTDMDVKVKQMIKLIEEDADSFARRAEMYYKKRPELMKLVEEFYRAYRALAERYDHATGVLRQAHRTMAETFPNQISFMLVDESPAGSATNGDPRTPDMQPIRELFGPDELQKDGLGITSLSHAFKRNGAFTEESDSVTGRKGLKQLNDIFGSTEGVNRAKVAEGRARKGLNFHDVEQKEQGLQNSSYDQKGQVPSESERVGKAELEILTLKNALAKLESEKEAGLLQYQQSLDRLSNLESEISRAKEGTRELNERASKAEAEVQTLKEALSKLEAEKEASSLQYQQCLEKITSLENNIFHAQKDAGKLNERANKAEIEAESLKQDLARLEAEKDVALVQYKQCLEKISDLEDKVLYAEEDARMFNERADKAEREVESLKQALVKLTEEKEAAGVQYQQCLETYLSLDHKLSSAQQEAQRLNSEIDDGVTKLKGAEERCVLLERANQTMHSELESLLQKMAAQTEELTENQKELGKLWACIQEERLRFMEAETAFQTLQHLHSQSQEELRSMAAELQKRAQILQDLEAQNLILQNEVEQVREENTGLNEVNLSSGQTIQNLRDEISSLRETIGKLEAEVELRVDQRNALQQEIYCLKEELNDLNKKHQDTVEQVESVGLRPECFGSSVKDLQDENTRLKDVCDRDRSEKVALFEKLELMEKLIDKNAVLENSLSDLNVELEGVRDKVKALEESCQSLWMEKSSLVSEKVTLVSQLQIATDTLDMLKEKSSSLENSLVDVNAELEGLRVKSKYLEDLCLSLENEKSDLATARVSLISLLDITQKRLEDSEKNYTDLEDKYFSLEKERESSIHKVKELQIHLDAEKQEHASLARLSKSQLAGMASQIHFLQEERQCRKKEYEDELDKAINGEIEIFILQQCICDLEEKNFSVLLDCQKLLEASKLSEKLIFQLEHESLKQQMEVKSLYDQIQILRMGLYQALKTLKLDANQLCVDEAEQDQKLLNRVMKKFQETQELLLHMQDEKQKLVIENSILFTLFGQQQLEVENLVMAKNTLDQELSTRSEQLLVLQSESQKIVDMNEALRLKITEGDHKEEALKFDLNNVNGQVLELQRAYKNLQEDNCKVINQQRSLMKSISELGEEKCMLKEENFAILAETVFQSTLSHILGGIICEKSAAIKELNEILDELHHINHGLKEKVKIMEGNLDELSAIKNDKTELHKMLNGLKCRYDEVEMIRENQEKQIIKLSGDYDQQSKEAEHIHAANQKLETELWKLRGELLQSKSREESLNHDLLKGRNEVELWESEAAAFFGELHISTIREVLLEGKVHELIESCARLEVRNCSKDIEIDKLNERVSSLERENEELKTQMTAYFPAFISLTRCIASLENHTLAHASLHEVDDKKEKDAPLVVQGEIHQQIGKEQTAMVSGGFLGLQELEMRVKAVENAVTEKERLFMLGYSSANSKLEAAVKHVEELEGKLVDPKQGGEVAGPVRRINGPRQQKQTVEISEGGNEVMTKDIILDRTSECSSYEIGRRITVDADDHMLEIWEIAAEDGSIDPTVGKSQKVITTPTGKKHDKEHSFTESLAEKEVGVDKLEISKRYVGARKEGNERKILERLDSDAQKLTNLQNTVQDLKRKVEITEKSQKGKVIEYDNVKEQLEESEESIMKLFGVNRELTKSVEDDSVSFDEKSALASDDSESVRRRKIAEQARRGSEKIGRLQLEVQKLQLLLLKLDDGNKSRGKTKITERKPKVLLRDFLYGGTRTTQKPKKGLFCACVQPPVVRD